MEVIFSSCWVLEIQNEVSTNQSGASTNHIGWFEGLGKGHYMSYNEQYRLINPIMASCSIKLGNCT